MTFTPLYDNVLILPSDAPGTKDFGGILMPDSTNEDFKTGIVVAVGCGYRNEQTGAIHPLLVKEKDVVMFGPYAGTKMQIDGTEFKVLREGEIKGILGSIAEHKPITKPITITLANDLNPSINDPCCQIAGVFTYYPDGNCSIETKQGGILFDSRNKNSS